MFVTETQIRVRYAETDQMGYVYHGNYAQYFEVARVEALRAVGLSYKLFEEMGVMMPVVSLQCKFLKPARYDDLLTIRTIIKELPSVRLHFFYEVLSETGVLLSTGEITLVNMDMKTQRPCKSPDILIERLKPFFE